MDKAYFNVYHIGAGLYAVSMVQDKGDRYEPEPITEPMEHTAAKKLCAKFNKIYNAGWKDSRKALGRKLAK